MKSDTENTFSNVSYSSLESYLEIMEPNLLV